MVGQHESELRGHEVNAFVWDINPTLLYLGPLQLRYYGIIFASMLYIGFIIWKKQALRGGIPLEITDSYLLWGVVAVLAGSRLGHCLFYEPERYLAEPISLLYFWKGGLASHGATVGVIVSLILFSLRHNYRILEILDRFTMPSAVGAAAVRLGNFFNSEIVGRETDLPWAVRFPLHDCQSRELCSAAVPRHPSQLYEFAFGLFVLLTLYLADRFAGKERRPLGMMTGIFLTLYFMGRFFVEFVKEYQVDRLIESQSFLTMGQYLSIIPWAVGICILIWSLFIARVPTNQGGTAPEAVVQTSDVKAPQHHSVKKGKSRKKRR